MALAQAPLILLDLSIVAQTGLRVMHPHDGPCMRSHTFLTKYYMSFQFSKEDKSYPNPTCGINGKLYLTINNLHNLQADSQVLQHRHGSGSAGLFGGSSHHRRPTTQFCFSSGFLGSQSRSEPEAKEI